MGTSAQRLKLVSNETPNDVSMVRRQDVSVVALRDTAQEGFNDVSKVPNHNVSSKNLFFLVPTQRETGKVT